MGITPILAAINRSSQLVTRGSLENHWDFAEGTGQIAHDDIGANDGIAQGTPTWSSAIPTVKHSLESSIIFDGVDDYFLIPQPTALWDSTQEQSISFWMRLDSVGSTGATDENPTCLTLVSDQNAPFMVWVSATGNDGLHFGFQGDYEKHISSLAALSGQWVHVGIAYNGLSYNADENYVVCIGGITGAFDSGNPFPSGEQANYLGRHSTEGSFFNGGLYDIRKYNKFLGLNELFALASGYDSLWLGSGTGIDNDNWNDGDNWPLNGVPSTGNAVLFDGTATNGCLTDLSRITVKELTISSGYTNELNLSRSFLVVQGDFTDNSPTGTDVLYPPSLSVAGNCDLSDVTHVDNISNTTIILDGTGNQNLTLPAASSIILNNLIFNSDATVTLLGDLDQVRANRIYVKSGILNVNNKYLTLNKDFDIIGGDLTGMSTGDTHTIGSNVRFYGASETSLMDLSFPALTTLNVTGSFLIRNARVGNLDCTGTAAECLNCIEVT